MSVSAEREPRPTGYLLEDLAYFEEAEAAAALGLQPQTLIQYRKSGIGPEHVELARRILYSRDALAAWLANGGTRGTTK